MDITNESSYYIPRKCKVCGGIMVFKGLGEYVCEKCGEREFDDYGKVRNYIDTHRGATAIEIEKATGVSQKSIRSLLREERIEVAKDSKIFIRCERCGTNILSGRYCEKCAKLLQGLSEQKTVRKNNLSGYASADPMDDGEIRFKRTR